MNRFTHKELGLVCMFGDIETAQDMQYWIRLVEKLPAVRAALVMREALLFKVAPPKETRDRLIDMAEAAARDVAEAEAAARRDMAEALAEAEGWGSVR